MPIPLDSFIVNVTERNDVVTTRQAEGRVGTDKVILADNTETLPDKQELITVIIDGDKTVPTQLTITLDEAQNPVRVVTFEGTGKVRISEDPKKQLSVEENSLVQTLVASLRGKLAVNGNSIPVTDVQTISEQATDLRSKMLSNPQLDPTVYQPGF